VTESASPADQIVLTHFIVSADVERACRFYTEVLGGKTVTSGEPCCVALANSWIIINAGGGPTDDKPTVTLETPPDPRKASLSRTSAFVNREPQTGRVLWRPRGGADRARTGRVAHDRSARG
jgi:hypothetical protein